MSPTLQRPRRSREDWLEAALELLSKHGEARIRVRDLCAALGVTTGSFYAHFEGREDLVRSLTAYWRDRYTLGIVGQLRDMPGDPRERLHALAKALVSTNLARYDLAVRAWAAHDPALIPIVREVDRTRFRTLRQLFVELGFEGRDLDMRTRTFVTFYSLELAIHRRQSRADRLAETALRVEMLAGP